jgi:DNA-3-methyladenine glycosylase II
MALLSTASRPGQAPRLIATACRDLCRADPVLRRLIREVGGCSLRPRPQHFAVLCDSIIAQQLSAAVAAVIFRRFAALFLRNHPTPHALLRLPAARLRQAGLSRQKARYLRDLAAAFLDGRVSSRRFDRQTNEELIAALTSVHGIGRWTAEMFLIFSLNRLDVLPVDDLGIRKAIQRGYGLARLPTARHIRRLARPWHPYETIPCWYLWRSLQIRPAGKDRAAR